MNILAITQARLGSTRLPGKIFKKANNQTLLEIHLKRILKSGRITRLLVATTTNAEDDSIEALAQQMNVPVYRGSENDVLDRFYRAALPFNADWIVRITSDCPLIDARVVDQVIDKALAENLDYCSNTLNPTFPNGMDVEVFKMSVLEKAANEATLASDREHVTPYIYKNSSFHQQKLFSAASYEGQENYGDVRLTVDEEGDYEVIRLLIEKLGIDKDWKTYADFYLAHREINALNGHIERNEGYIKSLKNDSTHDNEV